MKLALSTNWNNRRLVRGEEIAAEAKELGFDALELGFNTTSEQANEILKCGLLPVESVHAFCPVPLSAPGGYPELYPIASFDEETRAMARFQLKKNIVFAAQAGATALVVHPGRINRGGLKFFARLRLRRMSEIFAAEMAELTPELEKNGVILGIENMPYLEVFPNVAEMEEYCGKWVRPWYDTGHGFVTKEAIGKTKPVGMHLNDSNGGDDHLPPGEGKVDFKQLSAIIKETDHLVFEPNESVTKARLRQGMEKIKGIAI